jgi:hypothetical protein
MHDLRLALAVAAVEEIEHILLKLLAVPIDVLSCLPRVSFLHGSKEPKAHLLDVGQVYLSRDDVQTSEEGRDLAAAFSAFLLQSLDAGRVVLREAVVEVEEVVRCLRTLPFDMNRLQLLP